MFQGGVAARLNGEALGREAVRQLLWEKVGCIPFSRTTTDTLTADGWLKRRLVVQVGPRC